MRAAADRIFFYAHGHSGWETVDLTGVMPRVIDQYDRLGYGLSRCTRAFSAQQIRSTVCGMLCCG